MRVFRRLRTHQEASQLLDEVNNSGFIGQFSHDDMQHLIDAGTIRFFYDEENELVGFGAWEEINKDWIEVGPFFTRKKFRGEGKGREIIEIIFQLNARYNLFAVTKNTLVKAMFARDGFRTIGLWKLPVAILLHQGRRLTPQRIWNLLRKFRLEPVSFLVRTRRGSPSSPPDKQPDPEFKQ